MTYNSDEMEEERIGHAARATVGGLFGTIGQAVDKDFLPGLDQGIEFGCYPVPRRIVTLGHDDTKADQRTYYDWAKAFAGVNGVNLILNGSTHTSYEHNGLTLATAGFPRWRAGENLLMNSIYEKFYNKLGGYERDQPQADIEARANNVITIQPAIMELVENFVAFKKLKWFADYARKSDVLEAYTTWWGQVNGYRTHLNIQMENLHSRLPKVGHHWMLADINTQIYLWENPKSGRPIIMLPGHLGGGDLEDFCCGPGYTDAAGDDLATHVDTNNDGIADIAWSSPHCWYDLKGITTRNNGYSSNITGAQSRQALIDAKKWYPAGLGTWSEQVTLYNGEWDHWACSSYSAAQTRDQNLPVAANTAAGVVRQSVPDGEALVLGGNNAVFVGSDSRRANATKYYNIGGRILHDNVGASAVCNRDIFDISYWGIVDYDAPTTMIYIDPMDKDYIMEIGHNLPFWHKYARDRDSLHTALEWDIPVPERIRGMDLISCGSIDGVNQKVWADKVADALFGTG